MRYRIEQLANASQISVDTIRYYQNLKLLAPPVRDGRVGWYKESHLRRLQEVQELSQHGFTLEQIRELDNYDPLLRVLASKSNSDKTYTAAQLARYCGLDQDRLILLRLLRLPAILQPPANRDFAVFGLNQAAI